MPRPWEWYECGKLYVSIAVTVCDRGKLGQYRRHHSPFVLVIDEASGKQHVLGLCILLGLMVYRVICWSTWVVLVNLLNGVALILASVQFLSWHFSWQAAACSAAPCGDGPCSVLALTSGFFHATFWLRV